MSILHLICMGAQLFDLIHLFGRAIINVVTLMPLLCGPLIAQSNPFMGTPKTGLNWCHPLNARGIRRKYD